jgi:hypothetical protein
MSEIDAFISSYRDTWEAAVARADVGDLTKFFHTPYFAIDQNGDVTTVADEGAIWRYNKVRLEHFIARQATRWSILGCDALAMGNNGWTAIVNWQASRADGGQVLAWRHHYCVARRVGQPKILVSSFSPGS